MSKLLYIAALLVVCAQTEAGKSKCPWALGKYPFDETKFTGEWNLIAATPGKTEKNCKCGKVNLSATKNGDELTMSARFTARSGTDDKPFSLDAIMQAYKADKASMSIGVYRKEGTNKWSDVYKHSVIATDYNNYAVTLTCRPQFDETTKTFGRHLKAEIWGRKETLNQEVLDTLINILSGYDVDVTKITKIEHTNCN